MRYRSNLGCLWLLLLIFVLGGMPLLVGVLRVFAGFVLLALLGGIALSWWIRRLAINQYSRSRGADSRRFVELLVGLLVQLAGLDGVLDRREVAAIRQFFQQSLGYQGEQLLWIRDLIKASRREPASVAAICEELAASYGVQERFIVVQVLARVASADGPTTAAEARFIEDVATRLGLGPFVGAFASAGAGDSGGHSMHRPDLTAEALAVLGLEPGASADEIKQAWRKLSLDNHPDRVGHLGEEFRRLAEERMSRINSAYQTLKDAGLAT